MEYSNILVLPNLIISKIFMDCSYINGNIDDRLMGAVSTQLYLK
jgi:hypothetical protein